MTVDPDRYDAYLLRRLDGKRSASQALAVLKQEGVEAPPDLSELPVMTGRLVTAAIGIVTFYVVRRLVSNLCFFEDETLWVESPSGRTVRQLPFPIALRVVRKRDWRFAEVRPVKPPRVVSRREALGILFFGDPSADR